jgi:hypothetical protein
MASSLKEADLAGPGSGDYGELEHVLPEEYKGAHTIPSAPRSETAERTVSSP